MARTASDKFNHTPSEEYTALNPQQKRLTWLFYRSLQTHYKEGLDPRPEEVPGGINRIPVIRYFGGTRYIFYIFY
jgi:hypothetical protein